MSKLVVTTNLAVSRGFGVLVQDYLPNGAGLDVAGAGILHGDNMALHRGLDRGVLEGQVCIIGKGTILQDEVFAVAQGLASANMAAHQPEVLGIPA